MRSTGIRMSVIENVTPVNPTAAFEDAPTTPELDWARILEDSTLYMDVPKNAKLGPYRLKLRATQKEGTA